MHHRPRVVQSRCNPSSRPPRLAPPRNYATSRLPSRSTPAHRESPARRYSRWSAPRSPTGHWRSTPSNRGHRRRSPRNCGSRRWQWTARSGYRPQAQGRCGVSNRPRCRSRHSPHSPSNTHHRRSCARTSDYLRCSRGSMPGTPTPDHPKRRMGSAAGLKMA